jgi:hypothetical protein
MNRITKTNTVHLQNIELALASWSWPMDDLLLSHFYAIQTQAYTETDQ